MTFRATPNRRQAKFARALHASGDIAAAFAGAYDYPIPDDGARRDAEKRARMVLKRPAVAAYLAKLEGKIDDSIVLDLQNRRGDAVLFNLENLSRVDIVKLSDERLARLEALTSAAHELARGAREERGGTIPPSTVIRQKRRERPAHSEHAEVLLAALQTIEPSMQRLDYNRARRLYLELAREHGWSTVAWSRVSRSLRSKMRRGRRPQYRERATIYLGALLGRKVEPAKEAVWMRFDDETKNFVMLDGK